MASAALESVLKRDRSIVFGSLVAITTLAWAYVVWLYVSMTAAMCAMPGMVMMPGIKPWNGSQFALTVTMWSVMMVGMMTPSATPMILLYARVGGLAQAQAKPFASTLWFAGGYLVAWIGFALVASFAQSVLLDAALITPMLASTNTLFGGIVLLAAGIYQWTPLKEACLAQCQAPLAFLMRHGGFKPDPMGAASLGFKHGLYCIGCCWALMALLFVGGVMNLLWIAALSILVLLEKILPSARLISRGLGLVLGLLGLIFLYRTVM